MLNYNFNPLGLSAGILSSFDIGATVYENTMPLARGLDFDMEQLSKDQNNLAKDYKKTSDRIKKELSGDSLD